jgi:hypothetical protein
LSVRHSGDSHRRRQAAKSARSLPERSATRSEQLACQSERSTRVSSIGPTRPRAGRIQKYRGDRTSVRRWPRGDAGREQSAGESVARFVGQGARQGKKDILITHKPNIIDALGKDWFDVREGEASIFKPEGGEYRLVARVHMEDWPRIAAAVRLMGLIRCVRSSSPPRCSL